MSAKLTMRWRRAAQVVAAGAFAAVALGAGSAAGQADEASDGPYSMELRALTGPKGADLKLDVTAAAGYGSVDTLKKVQLKTFGADGSVAELRNINDVPAPDGVANIDLGQLDRGRRVEADVLVQTGTPERTYVVRGEATALLRPDLVVSSVQAPLQTLTTRPAELVAEVAEMNGDTGADATVTVLWGPSVLAVKSVTVPAGGKVSVEFDGLALSSATPVELSVLVDDAAPFETDETNNLGTVTVDVSELELARSRLLVPGLGGYGAQFNQHVYAAITSAPPGSLPDLEAKVKALEPQLARIFFNRAQEADPDKMASFVESVALAQEAGATINITYQSTAAPVKNQPALYMGQFAAILEDLVRTRGYDAVRWVTIQNEPNTTDVTLAQYEALYRALHAALVTRGLRDNIGLMGGDLVESGGGPGDDQTTWFDYMAEHMNDVLDAYSVHIYWNYWDTARMVFRLRSVRQLVDQLPADAQKPVYITEFGVRGIRNLPGKPEPPGYWEDGTQMARTNIAAFQQLWFNLASAQLGYTGTVKWDAYWGKYDNGTQSHWLIGPAAEGWPLFPAYHAIRLLLQTTQRGWHVLGIDPWTDDDWEVGTADAREREVAAYAGPNGELTLIGLDTNGRGLNAASTETPQYSIGGLPPSTTFNLAVWNAAANGENQLGGTVTTSAAGVARFELSLHGAFALTTVPVS